MCCTVKNMEVKTRINVMDFFLCLYTFDLVENLKEEKRSLATVYVRVSSHMLYYNLSLQIFSSFIFLVVIVLDFQIKHFFNVPFCLYSRWLLCIR